MVLTSILHHRFNHILFKRKGLGMAQNETRIPSPDSFIATREKIMCGTIVVTIVRPHMVNEPMLHGKVVSRNTLVFQILTQRNGPLKSILEHWKWRFGVPILSELICIQLLRESFKRYNMCVLLSPTGKLPLFYTPIPLEQECVKNMLRT